MENEEEDNSEPVSDSFVIRTDKDKETEAWLEGGSRRQSQEEEHEAVHIPAAGTVEELLSQMLNALYFTRNVHLPAIGLLKMTNWSRVGYAGEDPGVEEAMFLV